MRCWRGKSGLAEPLVVVNIGGVAQVTYIKGDLVLAFDTGPGNAPIDDWMHRHSGRPVDEDGAFAATGKVNDARWTQMLANPFFDRVPPKSLDRMDFGMEAVEGLSPADGAATLTAFTAASLARAREHFPDPAETWIVSGGGAPQQDADGDAEGAGECAGDFGGRCRLGRRCAGSAGLRLSGDAFEEGLAAVAADHHGRASSR